MKRARTRFVARTLMGSVALSVGVALPACEDHHSEPNPANADVVYEGGTNDEAFDVLMAASASADAAKATTLQSPTDQAALPAASPADFTWKEALGRAPARAPRSGIDWRLSALVGPERSAWAHGTPVNGKAYALIFSTANNARVLRVFTKSTSYRPDAVSWNKLVEAQGPITATITAGNFDNNKLVQGAGPYVGGGVTFTVQR